MKRLYPIAASLLAIHSFAAIHVTHLSVEGRQDQPLGLDVTTPRLGWQLEADADEKDVVQTRYHILVASSPELLQSGQGDLWDAEVESNQSLWIDYRGKKLKPNQRAYWKVQTHYTTTNAKGKQVSGHTAWSEPSCWGAGLLNEGNWRGNWIGLDYAMPWDVEDVHSRLSARYYRTSFMPQTGKEIEHATLHISGLGLYEASINGLKVGHAANPERSRVGESVLTPAPTDYRRSIIYDSYDVTSMLSSGQATSDTLLVAVSNGRFYTMQQKKKLYKITNFGYPTLRANLIIQYKDGSQQVISTNDKDWQITADGPIRSSNEYDGEIYDARKGSTSGNLAAELQSWQKPERSAIPIGHVRGNTTPGMQIIDELQPQAQQLTDDGRLVIDFGQNMAGWMRVPVGAMHLNEGDTVQLRFAEKLIGQSTPENPHAGYILTDTAQLYVTNLRHAQVTDLYIASGKENGTETWSPSFCYHGFRFAEITIKRTPHSLSRSMARVAGLTTDVGSRCIAEVISDPMMTLYTFETPNPVLNKIVRNAFWGIRSNYKGIPVDCPQRDERQPWLGDHSMGCWGESYMMDNHALYLKWLQDIVDSQRSDGCIPDVAPAYWNYYSDNVTWPSVLVFGAHMLYTQYGDVQGIARHYQDMRRWAMHFWQNKRDEKTGLIHADKYADWCCPPESPELIHSKDPNRVTDGVLIGSCYLYKILEELAEFTDILAKENQTAKQWEESLLSDQGFDDARLSRHKKQYAEMREELREAINREFLHTKRGTAPNTMTSPSGHILYPDSVFYSNNSVTANLLPLAFGIVPEDYAADVERWVMRKHLLQPGDDPSLKGSDGHIQCGVIGMSWLLRGLANMGRQDIAYMLATVTSYPGWGYMAEHDATTIWELWNGDTANPSMNSGNHIMLLGDLIPWCMENVGGIKAGAEGFKIICFNPNFELEELPEASVSYLTPYGLAASHWQKTDRLLCWDVTVPCNATGEVHLPYNACLPKQLSSKVLSTDRKILRLGSGHHRLEIVLDPSLPLRDHRTGGAYERLWADSLNADRQGIVCDQFLYDMLTAKHPSCHSASIAELTNGDLLATFFLGAREGAPDVCIYTSRKPKGCDLWEPLQLVANGDLREGATAYGTEIDSTLTEPIVTNVNRKACYNPVLFQIPGGDLLLFYKIGKNVRDWTGYLMRSSDGGHTWSDPRQQLQPAPDPTPSPQLVDVQCSDSLLGAIKNQPIWLPKGFRCANGTTLTKARILSPSSKETATASKEKAGQWRSYIEMSEDEGHTWAIYGPVPATSDIRTIQPTLLVHKDGRIQMLCRTAKPKDDHPELARMATSFSNDGGLTWEPMRLIDEMPNNNSGIDAVTMPDGTFALVYNPFSFVAGPDKPLRNPVCIATSNDGIHWHHRLTLEESPISQYSYPSLLLGSDGSLHAIYTWRRLGIKYQKVQLKESSL